MERTRRTLRLTKQGEHTKRWRGREKERKKIGDERKKLRRT